MFLHNSMFSPEAPPPSLSPRLTLCIYGWV